MKLKSLRVVVLRGLRLESDGDASNTNGVRKSAKAKEGSTDGENHEHDVPNREKRDDDPGDPGGEDGEER
jgi:hypothetical protein